MAKFFVHRPVFAIVISLLIVIAGGICIPNLPIAQYPEICPPVIQVTATYTGANAQVLEDTVAAPIEQQINGCEGMLYMRSICTNQGYYSLQITFDLSRDQDLAMVDVQNRISTASPMLPVEVTQTGVTVKKQSTQNLLYITLYSEDGSKDSLFLSNYTTINILDQLSRVEGVGSVSILAGQRDYSMRLWVKPDVLSKLQVTCDDIVSAISSQSVQAAAGSLGLPPQAPGQQLQWPVNVKGRLTSPEEFGNVIIRTGEDGAFLRVRDVATTELGASTYNSEGFRNGKPGLIIGIYQLPSANAVDLAKKMRAKMAELSQNFPEGVNYDVTYDSTIFVTKSIEEVVQTLFEAIGLVLIVVLLFLGNFRATVIPILAVPVSLVGTFAGFAILGFSINLLTMFALVLAVGIVVDDAIVVVEAVELHIEHGLSPREATEKALDEVSGPVIAIALVLCSVFVPVAFMGGMTGEMYKQFAVTLAISVLLSAVVALTLTPALCAMILRPRHEMGGPIGLFFKGFNKCFDWLTSGYAFIVKNLIRWFVVTLALLAVLYYSAFWLMTTTPTGFIPNEDMGNFIISVTLPSGASLERTTKVCSEVNEVVQACPQVKNTIGLVGYDIIQGTLSTNGCAVIATLKDWDERLAPEDQVEQVTQKLKVALAAIPEASIQVVVPPPVSGMSTTGGVTLELQDKTGGTVMDLFQTTQKYIGSLMQKKGSFAVAYSLFNPSIPMIDVQVDRDKLVSLGVPVASAFSAMQINLGGYYINQFNQFGRTWRVFLQAESKYRRTPSDIGNIYLRSNTGSMIPLSTVTNIQEITGPDILVRYNLYRATEVNAVPMPGRSSGQAIADMEQLATQLPEGFGYEWTSTAYQEKQASGQTVQILCLGLVFVFLFLAAQYESWGIPFAVLFSMPTVVLGALVGVRSINMDMNIYVQIGILMLIGLSAKNAILIVEYAKANYDSGMNLVEAAVAGARTRFRPILMTSFAFILGVAPLATAEGASAVCRRALGTSVLSGMLAATLIGVFIIPALYVFVQYVVNLIGGDSRKLKTQNTAENAENANKAISTVATENTNKADLSPEQKADDNSQDKVNNQPKDQSKLTRIDNSAVKESSKDSTKDTKDKNSKK